MVCTPKVLIPLGPGLKKLLLMMFRSKGFAVAHFGGNKRVVDGWQSGSFSKYVAKTLRINSVNKAVHKQRMSI